MTEKTSGSSRSTSGRRDSTLAQVEDSGIHTSVPGSRPLLAARSRSAPTSSTLWR